MMRKLVLPATIAVLMACAGQMHSGFQPVTDAAAIKAVFDTTAAGWNRGELPVYLSAYVDSATAMGSTGLVRGVSGETGYLTHRGRNAVDHPVPCLSEPLKFIAGPRNGQPAGQIRKAYRFGGYRHVIYRRQGLAA